MAKAEALHESAGLRRLLAIFAIRLSRQAYAEHSDCAEKKFYNHLESRIEDVEEAKSYAAWDTMLQSWESTRGMGAYKIAYEQMKDLL